MKWETDLELVNRLGLESAPFLLASASWLTEAGNTSHSYLQCKRAGRRVLWRIVIPGERLDG